MIVGFTNGCFDLLHEGHIYLLKKSRNYCDYLIVGLNSDNSVKRLKGKDRPIENQIKRYENLKSISYVDEVIIFYENTPYDLINRIQPDVLLKGSDYSNKNIVGAEIVKKNGGKVITIELLQGYSTTKKISLLKEKERV
tara:strand:- start:68 stop:484 length:417 start_codon:yes stop_codon:yes gene_type:complete